MANNFTIIYNLIRYQKLSQKQIMYIIKDSGYYYADIIILSQKLSSKVIDYLLFGGDSHIEHSEISRLFEHHKLSSEMIDKVLDNFSELYMNNNNLARFYRYQVLNEEQIDRAVRYNTYSLGWLFRYQKMTSKNIQKLIDEDLVYDYVLHTLLGNQRQNMTEEQYDILHHIYINYYKSGKN